MIQKIVTLLLLVLVTVNAESLRSLAAARNFYIGAAIDAGALRSDQTYRDTLAHQFNICVGENCFKFSQIHPAQNSYSFSDPDSMVAFAQRNNMLIRGHCLVWYLQVPSWLTNGTWTRQQALDILHSHISTVVGRYKGKITAWDVVNEAIDDMNSRLRTNSFWYQTIGGDYIDSAFVWAHQADSSAKLYYNDYGAEGIGGKADTVFYLVKRLKEKGIPVHGVGWQFHCGQGWRRAPNHDKNAQRFADIGIENSVTEFDVRLLLPSDSAKLASQARSYREMVDLCLAYPNIKALVMWGFTDKYSWIPSQYPGTGDALPFDQSFKPKPAYFGFVDGLKSTAVVDNGELNYQPKRGLQILSAQELKQRSAGYDIRGRLIGAKVFRSIQDIKFPFLIIRQKD
jgi:endo-1,4-beta-xylanase